jgi:hypothetical protein
VEPWGSLGMALGWLCSPESVPSIWLCGGLGVALGCLCTPESLRSLCLVYGFVVALGGFCRESRHGRSRRTPEPRLDCLDTNTSTGLASALKGAMSSRIHRHPWPTPTITTHPTGKSLCSEFPALRHPANATLSFTPVQRIRNKCLSKCGRPARRTAVTFKWRLHPPRNLAE